MGWEVSYFKGMWRTARLRRVFLSFQGKEVRKIIQRDRIIYLSEKVTIVLLFANKILWLNEPNSLRITLTFSEILNKPWTCCKRLIVFYARGPNSGPGTGPGLQPARNQPAQAREAPATHACTRFRQGAKPCSPGPWKNCLPWNQTLVSKKLGAAVPYS